jgi:hypothetical protein
VSIYESAASSVPAFFHAGSKIKNQPDENHISEKQCRTMFVPYRGQV